MSWNEFDLLRLTKLTDRSDIEEAQKISPIPTDRCVVGALQMNVEVGLPVLLLRIIKDGEPNLGETSTSQVRQIVGNSLIPATRFTDRKGGAEGSGIGKDRLKL